MSRQIVLNRNRKVPAEETQAFGAIAERFRRAGDLERAVALCLDGLKRFPNNLSARVTLGWALLDLGRYDEAREALESVLKRAPDNLAAIRGLAELHDRAEHTMMLPMDGPGQWPPPVDQEDTDELEATAAAVEAASASEAFEFPPPLTLPMPTPSRAAADLDPGIAADVVARAADAVAEAPVTTVPAADQPVPASTKPAPAPRPSAPVVAPPVAARAAVGEPSEPPVFLSSSGAPLPVSPVPEFEATPEAQAAATVEEPAIDSGLAVEPALEVPAVELDTAAVDLAELGAAIAEIEQPASADVQVLESEAPEALAPAASSLTDEVVLSPAIVSGESDDADEIAALEALLAQTGSEEPATQPAVAISAEAIVAPAALAPEVDVEIEVEIDDPTAFRLEPQSILALQALPTAEELAALEAEEEAAIAAALRGAVELPLIAACEAWVPEPDPEPVLQRVQPRTRKSTTTPRAKFDPEPELISAPVMATAATITTPTPLLALERFLRKVQARRQVLAAESMA